MVTGAALKRSRSDSLVGAVVLLVLTALVHVLICSHGPAFSAATRVDTPLAATASRATTAEQQDPTYLQTEPANQHPTHCWDANETTVAQPSRGIELAVPAVHHAQPADYVPAQPHPDSPNSAPPFQGARDSVAGRRLAVLGVCRT